MNRDALDTQRLAGVVLGDGVSGHSGSPRGHCSLSVDV